MRIAILIIGLVFAVLCGLQSFIVALFGEGFSDTATADAGYLGMGVALFLLLGAAFALNIPLASAILFFLGGLIGVSGSSAFPDLAVWGWISIILAVLSGIAFLIKRRAKRRAQEVRVQSI